jgi:hypothetical protein
MEELFDHFVDLQEGSPSMETRSYATVVEEIGTPEQLASAAEVEYLKTSFSGRHPVWTFLVAPIPLLAATFIGWALATFLVLYPVVKIAVLCGLDPNQACTTDTVAPSTIVLMRVAYISWVLVPFALTAWFLSRFGCRSRRSAIWPIAACVILALFGTTYNSRMVLPVDPTPGSGTIQFGFGFPPWNVRYKPAAENAVELATGGIARGQLLQSIVPLAICLVAVWRTSRKQRMQFSA